MINIQNTKYISHNDYIKGPSEYQIDCVLAEEYD
jgi:hypothetical protein